MHDSDPMHYADFCSQTQTEFLTMGCADRRLSSHQCVLRALDYASSCACDRRNCADHSTILRFSALGTLLALLAFYGSVMLGCVGRWAAVTHGRRARANAFRIAVKRRFLAPDPPPPAAP